MAREDQKLNSDLIDLIKEIYPTQQSDKEKYRCLNCDRIHKANVRVDVYSVNRCGMLKKTKKRCGALRKKNWQYKGKIKGMDFKNSKIKNTYKHNVKIRYISELHRLKFIKKAKYKYKINYEGFFRQILSKLTYYWDGNWPLAMDMDIVQRLGSNKKIGDRVIKGFYLKCKNNKSFDEFMEDLVISIGNQDQKTFLSLVKREDRHGRAAVRSLWVDCNDYWKDKNSKYQSNAKHMREAILTIEILSEEDTNKISNSMQWDD